MDPERKLIILEAIEKEEVPLPPADLGKKLQTVDDVRRWLSHPSNWHQSEFEHLRWGPNGPTISIRFGQRHQACPEEATGFYKFVLLEQVWRKERKKDDQPEEPVE